MHRLCEDCGAHAAYAVTSERDAVVNPPDVSSTWACEDHRMDVTERMLNLYGNATVVEDLG